jgi:hypothetical protein
MELIDFNDEPVGRRDAMKGLVSFTAGVCNVGILETANNVYHGVVSERLPTLDDLAIVSLIAGTVLFMGYAARGVYRRAVDEIGRSKLNQNN